MIFIVGIFFTLKSGSFSPRTNPKHKKWFGILVLGYLWYFVMHGAWVLAALGHERMALTGGIIVMVLAVVATWLTFRRSSGVA